MSTPTTVLLIAPDKPLPDLVDDFAVLSSLKANGWTVKIASDPAGKWETQGDFCKRIGISPSTFIRRVQRETCPNFAVERAEGGRLVRLQATPELEAFLTRNKE